MPTTTATNRVREFREAMKVSLESLSRAAKVNRRILRLAENGYLPDSHDVRTRILSSLNRLGGIKLSYDDLFPTVPQTTDGETGAASFSEEVNRIIEFPEEYFQAGVSLLSYFGTVLRNRFSDTKPRFSLEQSGLRVILTVTTEQGNRQRIERALDDYTLAMSGERPLSDITTDEREIIELRAQLRLAHAQVEFQRDMLNFRNADVQRLDHLLKAAVLTGRPTVRQVTNTVVNTSIAVRIDLANPLFHSELDRLIRALECSAIPDERAAGIAVGKARDAAVRGDESSVVRHLKRAGSWALKTAGEIGAKVVEGIIRQTLGL